MSEQKNENRNPDCPCRSTSCERKGYCEKCREFHHSRGQKTTCERNAK